MTTQDVHELLVMTQRERDEARAESDRLRNVIDATAKEWLKIDGIPFDGAIDGAMRAAVGEITRLRAANDHGNAAFAERGDRLRELCEVNAQIGEELRRKDAELARLRAAQNERAIAELEEVDAYYGNHGGLTTASFVRTHIRTRIAALRAEQPAPVPPPVMHRTPATSPFPQGSWREDLGATGNIGTGSIPPQATPPADAPSRPSVEELRDIDNTLESHDGCYDEAAISALRIAVRLLLDDALAARGGVK